MENMTLTPRLALLAHLVPAGARLADIGCDHGKLTIQLLLRGQIAHAIAGDIREGPLAHAKQNAVDYGVQDNIAFRLTAGLSGITPDACDTIAIAGMGGETIAEILADAPWTQAGAHTLLLQPMTMLPNLRQWLWAQGYQIEEEHICREDKRYYVVLRVRGGATPRQVKLSQCILSAPLLASAGAADYLQFVQETLRRAIAGLSRAQTPRTAALEEKQESLAIVTKALEGLK